MEEALSENALGGAAWVALDFVRRLQKAQGKIAVIADDVFQAIGLDVATTYVKALLNLIEYPASRYERMVVLVTTSEGGSRREIGRHLWAEVTPMWNMARNGFLQLYEKIPGHKPPFEEAWRLAGGNPNMLVELYKAGWDVDEVVKRLIVSKGLSSFVRSLGREVRELLWRAVEDPDSLLSPEGVPLLERLIDINVLIGSITYRDPPLWMGVAGDVKSLRVAGLRSILPLRRRGAFASSSPAYWWGSWGYRVSAVGHPPPQGA